MELSNDLSGSMSKNRFRNELLWGLWKAFDIYNSAESFTMVFDNVCDIELHLPHSLEFYQIKTRKNSKSYTVTDITRRSKGKRSILGGVYLLKGSGTKKRPHYAAIVSNVTFKSPKKEYTDVPEIDFDLLDEDTKSTICKKLEEEFPGHVDIGVSNIYYIRSQVDLFNPNHTLIGKMVTWSVEHMGQELHKPNALYHTLFDMIHIKACYEFSCDTYEEVVKNKGITKQQMESVITVHMDNANLCVKRAKKWIEENYTDDFMERLAMQKALADVVQGEIKDSQLRAKKKIITQYINDLLSLETIVETEIIMQVVKRFEDDFVVGYDLSCLRAMTILILQEMEEEPWR